VTYSVSLDKAAAKDMNRLDARIRRQLLRKIAALGDNPRPQDVKQLKSRDRAYRVDSGEYRILYQIDDDRKIVWVFRVGNRKDVYRGM